MTDLKVVDIGDDVDLDTGERKLNANGYIFYQNLLWKIYKNKNRYRYHAEYFLRGGGDDPSPLFPVKGFNVLTALMLFCWEKDDFRS